MSSASGSRYCSAAGCGRVGTRTWGVLGESVDRNGLSSPLRFFKRTRTASALMTCLDFVVALSTHRHRQTNRRRPHGAAAQRYFCSDLWCAPAPIISTDFPTTGAASHDIDWRRQGTSRVPFSTLGLRAWSCHCCWKETLWFIP